MGDKSTTDIDDREPSLDDEDAESLNVGAATDRSFLGQIIILHTRPVWKNFVILISVAIEFQMIIYSVSFKGSTNFPSYDDKYYHVIWIIELIYLTDTIMAIIYKKWVSLIAMHGAAERSIGWLVVDLISLVPLDLVYRATQGRVSNRYTHSLSLNHLLRIYRIYVYFNETRNNVGQQRVITNVMEFLVLFILGNSLAVAIVIHNVVMEETKDLEKLGWMKIFFKRASFPESEFQWCMVTYYVMLSEISGHGLAEAAPGNYSIFFILFVMLSLWRLKAMQIAYTNNSMLRRDYNLSLFDQEMKLIDQRLNEMSASESTRKRVIKYYNHFWSKQGGSVFTMVKFKMYPIIFLKECALELSWDAYKHSCLFRNQPIPFLRNLAICFERQYYQPGDTIFSKYHVKNEMVYVVEGTIQILSDEDDETPILSFSGGTILGESTLIVSHRSLCNVIALTEVELNVLPRIKFMRLMSYRYKPIYRELQTAIRRRYWKALRMNIIGNSLQKAKSHVEGVQKCTDTAWLKTALKILQNRNHDYLRKEKQVENPLESIYLSTDIRYTFMYLEMLVISDDVALKSEQVCLNPTIPWILRPGSTILETWEIVVLISSFILSLMIPAFMVLPDLHSNQLTFMMHAISGIYIIDLMLISSTAVYEKDTVYVTLLDIIAKRMHYIPYWADVVAALPMEVIMSLFGVTNKQSLAICKVNKLVKLYRFEGYFSYLTSKLVISTLVLRTIKYMCYMLILSYLCGVCILLIICPAGICRNDGFLMSSIEIDNNESAEMSDLIIACLYASQMLLGTGCTMIIPTRMDELIVTMLILIVGAGTFNYVVSAISTCQILSQAPKSLFGYHLKNITMMMSAKKVNKNIQRRVLAYLETEWASDNAYSLIFKRKLFDTATGRIKTDLTTQRFFSVVKSVPLFHEFEEECINQICSIVTYITLPPHEVIAHKGNDCNSLFVIEKGHCQLIRTYPMQPLDMKRKTSLYVLEMCCKVPIIHTTITVTHVSVMTISLTGIMNVLSHFPNDKTCYEKAIKKFKASAEYDKLVEMGESTLGAEFTDETLEAEPSKVGVIDSIKIHNPENDQSPDVEKVKSRKQMILKLLVLKLTIDPSGSFIIIWEACRCVFATLIIALYSAEFILDVTSYGYHLKMFRHFLNATAAADIYLRFHVGYYNAYGILVTNPLRTAKHYVNTGLLIDVIGSFPLDYFFVPSYKRNPTSLYLCRLNRLLQTHRIISAHRYHDQWVQHSTIVHCLKFIPMILLAAHVLACGFLLQFCIFGKNVKAKDYFTDGIYCARKDIRLLGNDNNDIIGPGEMYVYALLYVCATVTRIGIVNLQPRAFDSMAIMFVTIYFGYLFLMLIATNIIAMTSSRDSTLTAYQEKMKTLVSYLKEKKVHADTKAGVVDFFEYLWFLHSGTTISSQTKQFHVALRDDVLWNVYGPSLLKAPGFSKNSEQFFRTFFRHMDEGFFSKGTEILRVNDVHHLVYFIHKGRAEAFGPDGTRIAVLGEGSIFGNITGSSTMRQTYGIVTKTHVEALVLDSAQFFHLMMRHPKRKKFFVAAIALNTDFAQGQVEPEAVEVVDTLQPRNDYWLMANSRAVQFWEMFSCFAGCYLAFVMSLYQAAVLNHTTQFIACCYAVDSIFILKFMLIFFTAVEDDNGDFTVKKGRAVRRISQRLPYRLAKHVVTLSNYVHRFRLCLFTIIPFEVVAMLIGDLELRYAVFAYLRLNRTPRIVLLYDYLRVNINHLNINIFMLRMCYTTILVTILLHTLACIFIFVKSDERAYSSRDDYYIEAIYTITKMFAATPSNMIPKKVPEALYLIVLNLLFYVCYAVLIGEICGDVEVTQFLMSGYERQITFFRNRMKSMDLTHVLRNRTWEYGCGLWKIQSGGQFPQLIIEAPDCMQRSICNELYIQHLHANSVFNGCHEDFLRQLTFHMRNALFFTGNTIINKGDIDETMYFIDRGRVEAIHKDETEDDEISNVTLEAGESFGLVQGLLERAPHTHTYEAKTTVHIIYLYRAHWTYLLKYFPATKNKIYEAAQALRNFERTEVNLD